jgi:hypothetical protein
MGDYDSKASLRALAQDCVDRLDLYESGLLSAQQVMTAIQHLWAQALLRLAPKDQGKA